jgi:hypothetical protein
MQNQFADGRPIEATGPGAAITNVPTNASDFEHLWPTAGSISWHQLKTMKEK